MKIAPRKKSQYSGKACVKKLFAPFTSPAPSAAPARLPRPPTATQLAISIELADVLLRKIDRHLEMRGDLDEPQPYPFDGPRQRATQLIDRHVDRCVAARRDQICHGLGLRAIELLGIARRERHARAFIPQLPRHDQAETTGAAENQDGFAAEIDPLRRLPGTRRDDRAEQQRDLPGQL